jgi:hypothetical protein
VLTLKDATARPAGTETVDGAVNVELVLASVMSAPPAGAGWFTLTVQVLLAFGPRLAGKQESEETSSELASPTVVFAELPL